MNDGWKFSLKHGFYSTKSFPFIIFRLNRIATSIHAQAHTQTHTPAIHIYRSFNRIQNITLNVFATDLLFTPFTIHIWIYANQWARNTCKILESMPLFHSHKSNQIRSASAISSIVWSIIFFLLIFQSEYSTRVKWSAWCFCIS